MLAGNRVAIWMVLVAFSAVVATIAIRLSVQEEPYSFPPQEPQTSEEEKQSEAAHQRLDWDESMPVRELPAQDDRMAGEDATDPPVTTLAKHPSGIGNGGEPPDAPIWEDKDQLLEKVASEYRESSERAREFVENLPESEWSHLAYQKLGTLEASDPAAAFKYVDTIEDEESMENYYSGFMNQLAALDPDYAVRVHLANKEQFPNTGTLDEIMGHAARAGQARPALLAIRKRLPHDEHPQYFGRVYSTWAMVDRDVAIADLAGRPGSRAKGAAARALFNQLSHMDPEFVSDWIGNNRSHNFLPVAQRALDLASRSNVLDGAP